MHAALQLLLLWALAFLALTAALTLLNIYYGLIDNDLMLRSLRQEAVLAGVASLIEAGSLWLVLTYVPMAGRALIFPALVVILLYRVFHLEDWNNYDSAFLLLFQLVICGIGFCVFTGHVSAAILIMLVVALVLAVFGSIARSL